MSINKKLNEDYFKTKKKHKEEYGNISPKKKALNALIAFMIILIPYFLLDKCENSAKNSTKTEVKTVIKKQ